MAAKKTNYIEYELAKFEGYVNSIQKYLDENPLDDVDDRLDIRTSTNGNPIVKVIASKENIVKAYRENVEKLAGLLTALNQLRKMADEQGIDVSKRGGGDIPGIFNKRLLIKGNSEEEVIEDEGGDDVWD